MNRTTLDILTSTPILPAPTTGGIDPGAADGALTLLAVEVGTLRDGIALVLLWLALVVVLPWSDLSLFAAQSIVQSALAVGVPVWLISRAAPRAQELATSNSPRPPPTVLHSARRPDTRRRPRPPPMTQPSTATVLGALPASLAGAPPLTDGPATTNGRRSYLLPELDRSWQSTLDLLRPPRGRDEPLWDILAPAGARAARGFSAEPHREGGGRRSRPLSGRGEARQRPAGRADPGLAPAGERSGYAAVLGGRTVV